MMIAAGCRGLRFRAGSLTSIGVQSPQGSSLSAQLDDRARRGSTKSCGERGAPPLAAARGAPAQRSAGANAIATDTYAHASAHVLQRSPRRPAPVLICLRTIAADPRQLVWA